jgi:hypothetical protein
VNLSRLGPKDEGPTQNSREMGRCESEAPPLCPPLIVADSTRNRRTALLPELLPSDPDLSRPEPTGASRQPLS